MTSSNGGPSPAASIQTSPETPLAPDRQTYVLIVTGSDESFCLRSRAYVCSLCLKLGFEYTLLDHRRPYPQLTRELIETTIKDLGQKMRPEDFLLVWYMGHGQGNWSFALWDDLDLSSFEIFDLVTRHTPSRDIIIISDGCAAGFISEDLPRWFRNDPDAARLMKGRRELRHYHCCAAGELGWAAKLGPHTGLSYTRHVYRGFLKFKGDKTNQLKMWQQFNRTLFSRTEGVTLISGRLINILDPYEQHPGFARIVGPK